MFILPGLVAPFLFHDWQRGHEDNLRENDEDEAGCYKTEIFELANFGIGLGHLTSLPLCVVVRPVELSECNAD